MARKTAKNVSAMLPVTIAVAGGAAALAFFLLKRKAVAAGPPVTYPPSIPQYTPPPEEKKSTAEKWQETAQKIMTGRTAQQIAQTPGATEAAKSMLNQIVGTKPVTPAEEQARIAKAEAEAVEAAARAREAEAKAAEATARAKALDTAKTIETDAAKKAALEKEYEKATDIAAKQENEADEAKAQQAMAEDAKTPKPKANVTEAAKTATTGASILGVGLGTIVLVAGIGLAVYGIFNGIQTLQKKFKKYKDLQEAYDTQTVEYNNATNEINAKASELKKQIASTRTGINRLRAYAQATS